MVSGADAAPRPALSRRPALSPRQAAAYARRVETTREAAVPAPPPYTPAGWRSLDPVARRLMAARLVRSIAQGALAVDFVLYLKALGWDAARIGALLGAASLVAAALMMAGGVLSDRLGRRPFLVAFQIVMTAGGAVLALHPRSWVLVGGAVLLSYGRGANGAAGPFGPVEQAWLAQRVPPGQRGQVFSLNGAVGFWGMGLGSLVGAAVPLFARVWPGLAAYEPLFILSAVVAAINWWQIATQAEEKPARGAEGAAASAPGSRGSTLEGAPPRAAGSDPGRAPRGEAAVRRRENVAMALLAAVNAVNSLGIGLFSPLLPYWFSARYGAGAAGIGSVYGLTFLLTGFSSLATGQLTTRVGLVRAVVWVRVLGAALLCAMPLMPTYALAAGAYVVRSMMNRGSAGARQAFGAGLVRDSRRGLATSLNGLSMRLPSAIGPAVGGWLMSAGSLDLPFYLSAGLQLTYVALFGTVLGRYEQGAPAPPRRRAAAGNDGAAALRPPG